MSDTISLPGLIDPHVHFRDPGQTYKEDFLSGTSAALAGGYVAVIDMPNNLEPITTLEKLERKIASAQSQAVVDIGFYFGSLGDNFDEFPKVIDKVKGLKVYLNHTTGDFIIDKEKLLTIFEAWPSKKPILLHAEDDVSDTVWNALIKTKKHTHMCHVSSTAELKLVMKAKDAGLPISCGVTPHHLFLNDKDYERLGGFGKVKPFLKPQADVDFLWDHLEYIDVIESDHAPHTFEEKTSDNPPFGLPVLETIVPLLLTAESEGKITRSQIIERLSTNSARLFSVPVDQNSLVTVSMEEYELSNNSLHTKVGWSPFEGRRVIGKVSEVSLRGQLVFANGKILAKPGSGKIL